MLQLTLQRNPYNPEASFSYNLGDLALTAQVCNKGYR